MARLGDILGRWTLRKRIGGGGQGEVFEASSAEGGNLVAVKVIRTVHPKQVERLHFEMEAHRKLSDKGASNVMPLIEAKVLVDGEGAVSGFIVMPLARTKLSDHLALLRGRVDLCLELLRGICVGIGEAHVEGVVHRDVKPANILFIDESLAAPLVSDFGICLLRDTPDEERVTEVGETVGARFFMAPEQEHGGKVDVTPSADVYALAKLLHHMLTGRFLTREKVAEAFQPDELARLPQLAVIQERILVPAILEDPARRIQDVPTLIKIIDDIRGGAPPAPPPAPPPEAPRGGGNEDGAGAAHPLLKPGKTPAGVWAAYSSTLEAITSRSPGLNFQLDGERLSFREHWDSIYNRIKSQPGFVNGATAELIDGQTSIIGFTLAVARADDLELFLDWKRFVEFLLRSSEGREGYPAVFTIPHVLGGLLYMAASVVALQFESWRVFERLITDRFEWFYQSGRPLYSYGFALSFFFHSEALGRNASKTHNLFREILGRPEYLRVLTLTQEEMMDRYLQVQLAHSLRAAQAEEAGEDARLWPDFGRFYAHRVTPLLDRAYSDPDFSKGLLHAFQENKKEFFDKLSTRLVWAQQHFSNSTYLWESIDHWEPRR